MPATNRRYESRNCKDARKEYVVFGGSLTRIPISGLPFRNEKLDVAEDKS